LSSLDFDLTNLADHPWKRNFRCQSVSGGPAHPIGQHAATIDPPDSWATHQDPWSCQLEFVISVGNLGSWSQYKAATLKLPHFRWPL